MEKCAIILKKFLPLAVIITLIFGMIYITVQQNYRQSANDPQFQLAQDAVNSINSGASAKSIASALAPVEITTSLAPFLVIYDKNENLIGSNALLNGKPPKYPPEVIYYTLKNGYDAITWQPQPKVRNALVIMTARANSYIVVAGRSLKLVESRIGGLIKQLVFGWVFSLTAILLITMLLNMAKKNYLPQTIS